MLVLTRRIGECLFINGEEIKLVVTHIDELYRYAEFGLEAPEGTSIAKKPRTDAFKADLY